MEKRLLYGAFQDKETFIRLNSLDIYQDLSELGRLIWKEVERFYEVDKEATEVERDIILNRLAEKLPKQKDNLGIIVNSYERVSTANLLEDVIEAKRIHLTGEFSQAVYSHNVEKAEELLQQLSNLSTTLSSNNSDSNLYNNLPVSELIPRATGEARIKLLPKELNTALGGGVLRKHHIVIFGRPDIGKSSFLKTLVYGFLYQGLRVLYISNEEPPEDHLMRMLVRMTGMDSQEIIDDPDKAYEIASKKGWDRLYLVEVSPGTLSEIRNYTLQIKPDVLIVDQIKNVSIPKEDNKVLKLEAAAQGVRNIVKENNCLGISVTQAGDSANNKIVLDMGDVDFSNTGIPGTADLMIGFGGNEECVEMGVRYLSFPKNKISGIKVPIRVSFDAKYCRVY